MKGLRYLKRDEVDTAAWDRAIDHSPHGNVYAYAQYLDVMAGDWDALVLEDYRAVMPLPWRKKWSVHYLYQPLLTAQLGVFADGKVDEALLLEFLQAIPKKFRYWDLSFNAGNPLQAAGFPLYTRINFILELSKSYELLSSGYRTNIRRNIKKAEGYGCRTVRDIDVGEVISLAQLGAGAGSPEDYGRFRKLFDAMKEMGKARTYGILSSKGEVLASCVFFYGHGRAYYLLVGNHPNGRTLGASHALIDAFIRDHAGQHLILDFEGSDLRNLAFFYSSFGAVQEPYPALRLNRLPCFLRWMKR